LISVNDRPARAREKAAEHLEDPMSRRLDANEDATLRNGLGLLGVVLLASAALAVDLAREHMAALSALCGAPEHPHCGWCHAAAGLALMGVTALLAAVRPSQPQLSLRQIKAKLDRTCD
jgi:hypothetical protein